MRLHLPKALLAAVLAAGILAFSSSAQADTPAYSGGIYTWCNTNTTTADIAYGAWALSTLGEDGSYAYGDSIMNWNTNGSTKIQDLFAPAPENTSDRNTLRFDSSKGSNRLIEFTFSPLNIAGIIVETGSTGYGIVSGGTQGNERSIYIGNNNPTAAYSTIHENFSIRNTASSHANTGIFLRGTQTISIDSGKTLSLYAGKAGISISGSLTLTSGGTLALTGATTNNGALNIGSNVLLKVSEFINNVGSITFSSGVSIELNQIIKASQFTPSETTTGFHTATGGFTFATGTGTVIATDSPSCLYDGVSATVSWSDDHKTGTITSVGYYYIAENDTKTYSEAITGTPAWITVSERGTLSAGSGTIDTEINGGGTISVSAGNGDLSVSAEKLREFTGDLVVNSGRFNEVNNGHVFSNVSVADGGQFCINDSYNYIGNVSIAGTGWSNTSDYAWNGALRLGSGATLSGNLTLTDDANLIVYNGAKGTLSGTLNTGGHALTVKGNGKLLFGSNVVIGTDEGNADIVADNAHIGVNNNGSLSILKDYTCKGLYSDGQGTITIGDATHTIVNSVERIELGDSGTSGKITTLTVSANSVLKITGTNNDSGYKSASALLGEWSSSTTATIHGTLLSEGAALQAGDTGYTLNVESTGLVAAKGIKRAQEKNTTITVNLKGGSLILGDTGIAAEKVSSTSTGGVIGSYADTTTIASALSLTSGTTTTIDTSKYNINADNTVTVPTTGATGSTITISGNISINGESSGTKLEVKGVGALELSGTNTLYDLVLSGGTTTITGTTTVNGNTGDSKDREHGIVAANDTLTLTVSGILMHDDFKYVGSNLSGLSNGLSMWNNGGSGKVTVSGGTIEQIEGTRKDVYAALKDVKLINASDMDTRLYAGAELSGASVGGTLEVGNNTTTTIKNSVEGSTESSIAKLTGSGTLKTTGGTTTVTNASGFSGTLEATGGSLTANGTTTGDSGSVTLSTLAGLKATGGSIKLADVAATLTITDLVVAGNGSISGAESYEANKVSIGAGEAGSLVGNLSIQDGGTITLDASAGATTETGGTKGLSLSALTTTYADEGTTTTTGSLTLGSGLTLNLDKLGRLTKGDSLTLFSGVTAVNGLSADDLTSMQSGTLAAETVFNGVGTGNYNLRYSDNIVSIVAQRDTPEPTSATLSLLALMALAARRRRKA